MIDNNRWTGSNAMVTNPDRVNGELIIELLGDRHCRFGRFKNARVKAQALPGSDRFDPGALHISGEINEPQQGFAAFGRIGRARCTCPPRRCCNSQHGGAKINVENPAMIATWQADNFKNRVTWP